MPERYDEVLDLYDEDSEWSSKASDRSKSILDQ
jgi:hypothetical protein